MTFRKTKIAVTALGVGMAVFSASMLVAQGLERTATTPYDANIGNVYKQITDLRTIIEQLETKVETTQKDIITITNVIVKTNPSPDPALVEVVKTACQGLYSETGNAADWVRGSACNDTMYSKGGNDSLWGREGDDTIYAGTGKDTVGGGAGNDTIGLGSGGGSTGYGGAGDDTIYSGTGGNTVYGGDGADTLYAGQVAGSTVYGGAGNDLIYVKTSGSIVNTGAGNDTVSLVNLVNGGSLTVDGAAVVKKGNGVVTVGGKTYTADSSGKVTLPDGTVLAGLGSPAVKTCAWTYKSEACVSSSNTTAQAAPSGSCTCGQTTTKLRWKCAGSTAAKPMWAKVSFTCQ